MSGHRPLYRDLLPPAEVERIIDEVQDEMARDEGPAALAILKLGRDEFRESVAAAVDEALSLDVFDILIGAWAGIAEIKALTGPDGPADGDTRSVQIAAHRLSVTHTPELELEIRAPGVPPVAATVRITVEGRFKLGAVAVSVRNRRIVRVSAFEAMPDVVVKLRRREVTRLRLGALDFGSVEFGDDGPGGVPGPGAARTLAERA